MNKNRQLALLFVLIAVVAAIAIGWYLAGFESTEDAQVESHVHPVAPRIEGPVLAVHIEENQPVAAGQLLFEIDPRDYRLALLAAEADLAQARAAARSAGVDIPITRATANSDLEAARSRLNSAAAGVPLAEKNAEISEARLREAEALHQRARQELHRLEPLLERDEISRQRYDDAVATERATAASVDAARAEREMGDDRRKQAHAEFLRARAEVSAARTAPHRIEVTEAAATSAEARLAQAEAALEAARARLDDTRVVAPASGVVSRKRVEVGQYLRPGQAVLAVVDLAQPWVVANFKETQLDAMAVGQSVKVEVDAYPGMTLEGRVESLAPATGSRFALLPPDNASGNFVKVVQRVPVRINLIADPDPERPLRPGMSVVARVDVRQPGPARAAER